MHNVLVFDLFQSVRDVPCKISYYRLLKPIFSEMNQFEKISMVTEFVNNKRESFSFEYIVHSDNIIRLYFAMTTDLIL